MNSYRNSLCVVLLVASLLCIPWLERPFHTRGEPREALVSQAMLSTHNWISPPAYDGAVPSKPPFSHWLTALLSLPGGDVTEAMARLPSALAFLIFIGGFFVFVARRTSPSVAVGAAIVLISSSEWFRAVSTCRVDMLLAVSMSGALCALYAWWERGYRGVPLLAVVLTTCATLTKGPVGFVLPVGIFSLFCWLKTDFRITDLLPIGARAVALVVPVIGCASIWYLLGYAERGDAFIDKILYENFSRFTSSMADEPHKHSALYLLGMLLLGLLPWTLCGVCVLVRKRIQLSNFTRVESWRSWWRGQPSLCQFSIVSAAVIVLFFCIPSSKRSVYLLPAFPFLALLMERALRGFEDTRRGIFVGVERGVVWGTVALLCAALVISCVPIAGVTLPPQSFWRSLSALKVGSICVVSILLIGPFRGAVKQMLQRPIERLGITLVVSVAAISFCIYDTIAWQLSPKNWVSSNDFAKALPELQSERPPAWYSFGSEMYGASFYLKTPFARAMPGAVPAGALVMLEAKRIDEFTRAIASQSKEVFRYHNGLEDTKKDVVVMQVEVPARPVE